MSLKTKISRPNRSTLAPTMSEPCAWYSLDASGRSGVVQGGQAGARRHPHRAYAITQWRQIADSIMEQIPSGSTYLRARYRPAGETLAPSVGCCRLSTLRQGRIP